MGAIKPRLSRDICDICGRGVDAGQMSTHQRETHAFILDFIDECQGRARFAFVRAMIPGMLAFVILLLLIVCFVPVDDQYLLLLAFVPIIGSALYGGWLSQKEMAPCEKALESADFQCFRCGARISRSEFWSHCRKEHPDADKEETLLACSFIAIPLAAAMISGLVFVKCFSVPMLDAVVWSIGPGVATGLILVLLSEFVLLPHIRMNR